MKLIFIGDVQLDDRTPRARKDDYCLSVIQKLDWIFSWAVENKVDKIIFLGDIFNRKEVGGRARNLIIKLFKKYQLKGILPECLATIGNHDTNNDINNIKQSTLWTLVQTGLLKITNYDPESKVAFLHHHVHVDEDIVKDGIHHNEALIWSVHASLYPNKYQYLIDFNAIDITGPAKLFVCGHVHSTYSCKRSDGITLVNPGHVGRNAFLPYIKEHPVQILFVEHNGSSISKVKYIPVEVAKPYDEVFDLEKINLYKRVKKQVKQLVDQTGIIELDSFSMDSIINLAKKQLPEEVTNLVVEYLGAANAKL